MAFDHQFPPNGNLFRDERTVNRMNFFPASLFSYISGPTECSPALLETRFSVE